MAEANPFDQFDASPSSPSPRRPQRSWWDKYPDAPEGYSPPYTKLAPSSDPSWSMRREPSTLKGVSRALEYGTPFVDRAVARAKTDLPVGYGGTGLSYAENLAAEQAKLEQWARENPWTAYAGEAAGTAPLWTIPGPKFGLTGLAGQVASTATQGAAIGALQEGGRSPDLTDIPETARRAAPGAVGGAAFGGAMPVVAHGVGKVLRPLLRKGEPHEPARPVEGVNPFDQFDRPAASVAERGGEPGRQVPGEAVERPTGIKAGADPGLTRKQPSGRVPGEAAARPAGALAAGEEAATGWRQMDRSPEMEARRAEAVRVHELARTLSGADRGDKGYEAVRQAIREGKDPEAAFQEFKSQAAATGKPAERGPAGAALPTYPQEKPLIAGEPSPAVRAESRDPDEFDPYHERLKERANDPSNPYRIQDAKRLKEYEAKLKENLEFFGPGRDVEPPPEKPPAGVYPIGEPPRGEAPVEAPRALGAASSPTAPPVVRITEETGSRPLISQQIGLAERRSAQANSRIEETIRHEYAATPEQRKLYRNWIETRSLGGKAIPKQLTPELLQSADLVQSLMRDIRYELERLDPEAKQRFIEDYLMHMYKDTPALRRLIGGAAEKGARGGGGAAGHLKRRTIPTYDEAERLGITPKHDTVGETVQESVKMMNRFIAERDIEEGLKAQGFIHEAASGARIPDGWARIDSGRFRNRPVYAPKNIARDYNRFFKYPDHPWAQTAMEVNNALRGIKFFGPPYHLLTELVETATHDWSSALENIRNLQFGRAAGASAKALTHTGLGANYWRGGRGFRYYLGHRTGPEPGQGAFRKMLETVRGEISPEDRELVDILTQVNAPQARSSIDLFYGDISAARWAGRRGWLRGFKNGVYAAEMGNAGRTAVNFVKGIPGAPLSSAGTLVMAPFRGMAKITSEIMSPLFGELIPKAKFGASMQKLQDWIAANPGATHEEKLLAAAKIRQNADNLFGEMREDNQFMNRTVMLATKLTFLSPSWNIGTMRWAGGGIGDAIKATATIPVNVLARAIGKEKPFATPSISKASPTWNPSIATTYGAILETVLAGSVTTYFLTGRPPKDLLDIIAPPTGGVNERGEPDRIRPFADASFIADISQGLGYPGLGAVGFVGPDLKRPLESKLNTIPAISIDLLFNRDYKDKPIMGGVSPKESIEEAVKYMLRESLTPISFGEKGALRAPDRSNIPIWARAFGMSEAGMQFTNPMGLKTIIARKGRPTSETSTPEYKAAHPKRHSRHEDSMYHP